MNDLDIFRKVNALSEEEERLYRQAGDGGGLGAGETDRLRVIRAELDRCYDLLHQRVAKRDAGEDPGEASVRSTEVVERYQQ